MASMLLLNPRRRRRAKSANPKRRRRHSGMFAANPRKRRRNPARRRRNTLLAPRVSNPIRRRRRKNPIHLRRRHHARRRRNPLGFSTSGLMGLLMDAGVMGAGAVAFDVLWGQVNTMLPASLQTNQNTVGVGDAVKLAATVAIGTMLDKPTKGIAKKVATGALVVQFYDLISSMVPSTMTMAGMGFINPGATIQRQFWQGPNRVTRGTGMSALLPRGVRTNAQNQRSGVGALLTAGHRTGAQRMRPNLHGIYANSARGTSTG